MDQGGEQYYPHLGPWTKFTINQMAYAKNWVFVLNNWTEEEVVSVDALVAGEVSGVKFLMYSKETAPTTGTPHLQGYLQMVKKCRLPALKALMPRANFILAKGSLASQYEYIGKAGPINEFGTPTQKGERCDMDMFKDAVKEGSTLKRLREDCSEVCAKYPRFVREYLADHTPPPEITVHPLRDWQSSLIADLDLPPEDRKIIFVVDIVGNKGKTWFAKYYLSLHEDAQILEAAKKADMAYALETTTRVLFINCVRKVTEFLSYGFMEAVKDGIVFSPKYESGNKLMAPCHVVVLMNQQPDMSALSLDRYHIIDI